MIVDKEIEIKIAKYNIDHYRQFFDVKLKDLIKINTEIHLQKYSNIKVNVKCDICQIDRYIKFQSYTKNINSNLNHPIYTCDKCSHIKLKDFNKIKYGCEYYSQHPDRNDKVKKTSIKKYGVDHYSKTDEFKEKIKDTNLEKFGYISSNNFKDKSIKKNLEKIYTICNPIGSSSSIKEKMLLEYITSVYPGEIINTYRDKLEIDIYLPELKIGFEFNGLYWHSDKYKEKRYHLNKTNHFKDKGIRIIHIWEDDWDQKSLIIKSQIKNWIGLTTKRIYARKCIISEISTTQSVDFLNDNHIQGRDRSSKKIGLFIDTKLVSVMTFNKLEGRKSLQVGEWNLSRFCNLLDTQIVGGSSKLLSYFMKKYNPSRIISYADKDWSVGGLYYNIGFTNINESIPDYKYVVNGVRSHKQNFKKSKLGIEGMSITENDHMNKLGHYRIWDCGKIKFELKRNTNS